MDGVLTGQKCKDNFCEKTWKERDYLEDLGTGMMKISK